ncbi:MAG: nuclear transport factor 2 family protein [Steroidobacteraceae bacterium]
MKRRSVTWGLLALAMTLSGAAVQAAMVDGAAQAVLAGEHQWLKSQQTNDTELLAPLLADRVVETDDGKVFIGKSAVLADAKSVIWSSVEYTDLKVTLFGRTGIATGMFIGKGTHAGKPVDVRVRFTDTWVRMANGKWLCVASHDSDLKT